MTEINDFSGGKTDHYLGGPLNACQHVDNFVVNEYNDLIQRPGIAPFREFINQIPAGTQRIDSMYFFDHTLFAKSGTRLYCIEAGSSTWQTLDGPNAHAFADSEVGSRCTFSEWRGHLVMTPTPTANLRGGFRTVKAYRNSSGVWTLVQAGLPKTVNSGLTTISPPAKTVGQPPNYFIWYWCFTRSYTAKVNGVDVDFKDFGAPNQILEGDFNPITGSNTAQFAFPAFTNGAFDNYDTAGMRKEIFRTSANQQTPRYAVDGPNTSANIIDNVTDGNLGDPLYIFDGTADYDPVPHSYGSVVVDGHGFYGAGVDTDSGDLFVTRIYQSQAGNIDGVPADFYGEIEDIFASMSFVGPYPIVFSPNRAYRAEGRFDAFGQGAIRMKIISHDEGCPFPASIIRRDDYILFVSKNGICWTDGFKVLNLTRKYLSKSFDLLQSKQNIVGTFNSFEKRAYWAVEELTNLPPEVNNTLWTMNVEGEKVSVTTASSLDANMRISALAYDEQTQRTILGDRRGYVLCLEPTETSDIIVDPANAMVDWAWQAVVPRLVTVAYDFGTTKFTKWVSKVYFNFMNTMGNLSLAIFSHNDDKTQTQSLRDVRIRSNIHSGIHKVKRGFMKGGLRCLYKQIEIRKGYVNLLRSDDLALATANNGTKEVAIAAGIWPLYGGYDLRGYSIFFEGDGYTKGHLITAQSPATLLVFSPDNDMPVGLQKWVIAGYPKDEFVHLKTMGFDVEVLGDNYRGFRKEEDGFNAGEGTNGCDP